MDLEKSNPNSENPLNNVDFESKKLSKENIKKPKEKISISSENKNIEVVKELSNLADCKYKNQVSSQEQETSKTESPQYGEKNINISEIQSKEVSNDIQNAINEEDNNVSQSAMIDTCGQEKLETKETESVTICGQNSNTLAPQNILSPGISKTLAATHDKTELEQHDVMTLNNNIIEMVTNRGDNKEKNNFPNEENTEGNISLTKSEEQQNISKTETNLSNVENSKFVAQEIEPKDYHENITRNSKIEEISSNEPAGDFDGKYKNLDAKSAANLIIENDGTESLQNFNKSDENLLEAGKFQQLNVTNTKTENITTFTPRRSTRRASQSSADTCQPLVELSFTPRRSTRRASLSVESPTMSTPMKRITRRASLSVETPTATPKKISKRRPSISLDNDEIPTPSTSKSLRTKKSCNQLEQRTVIPEEIDEIVSAVIIEEEEESSSEKKLKLEYETPKHSTNRNNTTTTSPERLVEQLEQNVIVVEEQLSETSSCNVLEEKIRAENERLVKNRDKSMYLEPEVSKEYSDTERGSADATASVDAINFEGAQEHDKEEGEEKPSESLQHRQEIVIDETLEKTVTREVSNCLPTNEEQVVNKQIIKGAVADISEAIEDQVQCNIVQGIPDLLKTPKIEVDTPQPGGISDLIQASENVLESGKEIGKLTTASELLKTPSKNMDGVSKPKDKKHIAIVVESPQTPVMTGMRELLRSPKAEILTPEMAGLSTLVQTPNLNVENEQEVIGKLVVIDDLTKTPQNCKSSTNLMARLATTSRGNEYPKEVKELLKTPKICSTPCFRGMRELMKTPIISSTPIMSGEQELLKLPASQDNNPLENHSSNKKNLEKEPPQSPKDCKNLHHQRILEIVQTPNSTSSPVKQKEQELEKFLRTPRAKNIMIPSMPSSAIIEKSDDSIEISTEYDLNATHEEGKTNLEEIFKTSMAPTFAECITDSSYYNQQEVVAQETAEKLNAFKSKTLQETLNKTAEESFDKLVGQETYIKTPPRKIYVRKSIGLQTPQSQSPFTAADVLSDLPKTDIEEWIETLDEAEPPILPNSKDNDKQEQTPKRSIINKRAKEIQEAPWLEYSATKNVQNTSGNDSIIPETCTKVYLTENSLTNNTLQNIDPLSISNTESKENETCHLGTTVDAEISGINFLDQSLESEQEELSVLEEPLAVEEPSILEGPLTVSDNESEAENTLNRTHNRDDSQDEGNDLSEPLLLSESEDLNVSFDTPKKRKTKEPEETEISNFCINFAEEKSNSYAVDPLETEDKGSSNVLSEEKNKAEVELEATSNNRNESLSVTELVQSLDEQQLATAVTHKETPTKTEQRFPSEQETQILEKVIKKISEETVASTSQTNEIERESERLELNTKMESASAEMDEGKPHIEIENAKEMNIEQTKVEFVFIDNSATEICEETNIIEERVEHEKNIETKKKTDGDECQDIFMDNSNIDESFADEAISEENEAVVGVTPVKTQSTGALFSVGAVDSDKEIVCDTEEVDSVKEINVSVEEEVIEIERGNDILEVIEIPESKKTDNRVIVKENAKCDQTTKENIVSKLFVKSSDGNKCEQPEETQGSSLCIKRELPLQIETKASENVVVTELEFSDKKHLEKETSKSLVVEPTEPLIEKEKETELAPDRQTEPKNSVDDVVKEKTVSKLRDIPRIEITHDTAICNENLMESSLVILEESKSIEDSLLTEKQIKCAAQEMTPLKEPIVILTSPSEIVTYGFASSHTKDSEMKSSGKLTEDYAEGSEAKEFKLQTDQVGGNGERTTTPESQRISTKIENIDTNFQRDEGKEPKTPIEEKLKEIGEEEALHKKTLKDMTPNVSQQDKIPKRKRTTSGSSQGSAKNDNKKPRGGGRRKETKNPVEIIVVEECEESPLSQEFIQQEQEQKEETELTVPTVTVEKITEQAQNAKLTKLDDQIYLPEETRHKGQNISEVPVTTQEKQTTSSEILNASLHKAEEMSDEEKGTAVETVELDPEEEESFSILKIRATENSTVTLTSTETVDTTEIEKVSAETQEDSSEEIKLKNQIQHEASTKSTLIGLDEEKKPVATTGNVKILQTPNENLDAVLLSIEKFVNLNHPKPIDSESIQSKSQQDDNIKVRNIHAEKDVKDKSVERVLIPAASIEITDGNLPVKSISIDDKPSLAEQIVPIVSTSNDQLHEVQSRILKDQTQKRNRHKVNVSETSQVTDDSSRTRRGRRKIKKTPSEEILVEEMEKEKTNQELISANKLNDKDVLLKKNETEQNSSVNAKNEVNSGRGIEVPEINSKEYRQDPIQEVARIETSEHVQELSETVQMHETCKNEEFGDRRENKFDLKETVPEVPTTSRTRSRNVKASITAASNAESNEKYLSAVVTVSKDQEAEEVYTVSMSELPQLETIVESTIKQQEPEENDAITNKQTGKLEQQSYEAEIKESLNDDEQGTPIIEVFATPNTKTTASILRNDKAEIETEPDDKVPGSLESASEQQERTDKETHTDEHITKQTKTRGRRRKAEVAEVSIKKEASKISDGKNTRRAAKQKAFDSETHTVLPKIRSSNRIRKTPVEHLTTAEPDPSILNQKRTEIVDQIEIDGGITVFNLSEADSRNQNCEAPVEYIAASTQEEQAIEKEMSGILADTDDKQHRQEEKVSTEKRAKRTRLGTKSTQEMFIYEKPVRKRAQNQSTVIEKSKENDVESTDVKYASANVEKNENVQDHDEVENVKVIEETSEKPTKRRQAAIHEEPYNAESSLKSKRKRAGNVESGKQIHTENTTEPMNRTDHILFPGIDIAIESEIQLEQKASLQPSNVNEAKIQKGGRKHIELDHKECGPSSKRRVGRRKKNEENEKLEKGQHNMADKEQQIHSENTKNTSSEHDDNEKEIMGRIKNDEEPVNTEKSGNATTKPNEITNKPDLKEHDDHVSAETEYPQGQIKKGRALRNKRDQPEELEQPTKTISPKIEHRGRKRKEPKSGTPHDLTTRSENYDGEKLTNEPENKVNTPSEDQIPQSVASVAGKGRTAIEHITAESQEVELTPARRARNVPQRRAATAYHNYDETSDTEVATKTKKKTDPSPKPLEADKKLPAVLITLTAPTLNSTPLMSFTASPTTARGRTRKPTAKVQQFLEEERAKAETPKKKALLAAAAANIDGATPQRAPTRRGRKALTMESGAEGTSQIVKGKAKDKLASASTKEESSVVPESTTVTEIKEIESQMTPASVNVSKGRRGGRKTKITEEDHHDEPPAKKSPLELETEKHDLEVPTPPTRIAGRRNAAAAAKARIEEDALAAAAIELPKKTKAKKATAKALVAPAAHSSEVEEEHATEIENLSKNKNSLHKREHRLASASTIDGVEDLEEKEAEKEIVNKATSKRGRKVAIVTSSDSPALPLKRGRKPKILAEEMADPETSEDSKTIRDRGKRRKNVHFDENHAAEATSSSQQNATDSSQPPSSDNFEPTKKGKRTRRK